MKLKKENKQTIEKTIRDHFNHKTTKLRRIDLQVLLTPSNVLWAMLELREDVPYKIVDSIMRKLVYSEDYTSLLSEIIKCEKHDKDFSYSDLVSYIDNVYQIFFSDFEQSFKQKANLLGGRFLILYLNDKYQVDWAKVLRDSYSFSKNGIME